MTRRSRERVADVLAHRRADRIPLDSPNDPLIASMLDRMDLDDEDREYFKSGEFRYLTFQSLASRETFASYLPGLPAEATVSDWGVGKVALKSVEGYHAGHRTFHPLAEVNTVQDLDRFPFPDMTDPRRHAGLEAQVAEARSRGFTVLGQMSQTVIETAYEMRGLEQLMVDFFERPDYVAALFESIARRRRFQAERFARAGVDVLRIGDDVATQRGLLISPELYRRSLKPLHASVIAAARRVNPHIHVLYHSDGLLTPLLPDLIEIGVTAVNPVQPECMPIDEMKREFGRDLTFWGCTPVQSVFQDGGRGDVQEWLKGLQEAASRDSGIVVNFINLVVTDRSLTNLRHFFELLADPPTPDCR